MAAQLEREVADALAEGEPVVALESTIISHGLPRPDNLEVANKVEAAVRAEGAVPATIGIIGGQIRVGLDDDGLHVLALGDDVAKVSERDLAIVVARRGDGATTVAATAQIAHRAGIRVFATGGLGGVHRDAATTFDESADLGVLGRTGITVVCSGVKSILDTRATLERLESLGVSVVGMGTNRFPGFYLADSGLPIDTRVESAEEVAVIMRARVELGTDRSALVVASPLPVEEQVDPALHDRLVEEGLAAAAAANVRGKAVTPFLLEHFHRHSGGESLRANVSIILRNAALAARIAVAASR
jgi:pseudouridylate synthase